VLIDTGAVFDFFDLDDMSLLSRLSSLFLSLVLQLSPIENANYRRVRIGANLYEIQILILGALTRFVERDDTELRPIDVDQADGGLSDLAIDSGLRRISSNRFSPFASNRQISPDYRQSTRVTGTDPKTGSEYRSKALTE
jgi:hypothetical protein